MNSLPGGIMSKTVFEGKFLKITHTLEETGPHPSVLQDYYDDCFSVTAILQGSGSCFVEGNRYSLKANDMILLGVDEIRSFRFCQEGCHERISIYFTASLLSPFWECELPLLTPFCAHTPGAGNKCSAAGENREHALSILNRIRDIVETVETQPGTVSMPEARLSLLTVQLLFCLYDAFQTQDVPNSKLETDSLIREICRYIRDNLNEKLTYEHLQDRLFVSRYQLTEIFRRNTGMSLAGYILQKRLTKVISLVRNGVGIEHAAYQAGFKTYANFYKEFKKHKGISPQKYFADEKKAPSHKSK